MHDRTHDRTHDRLRRARSAFNLDRPRGARGLLPLILGALAAGKAIYGAVNANQVKQRNKGYIDDAYRSAVARQRVHEGDVRQGTSENLAARGLLMPGAVSPSTRIANAMNPQAGAIAPSRTLGARDQNETDRELALERHDLDASRARAQNENRADAINAQIGAIAGGAQGVANAYALSQLKVPEPTPPTPPPQAPPSSPDFSGFNLAPAGVGRIGSAMGIDNSANWWGSIHGLRPFDAPGSSFNNKQTLTAPGSPNYDFHL